eukprot:6589447-Pyramimonas_sp.AAC.1
MPQRPLGLVGRKDVPTGAARAAQCPPDQPRRTPIPTAATGRVSSPLDRKSGICHLCGLRGP